jgi:hypothetical protein
MDALADSLPPPLPPPQPREEVEERRFACDGGDADGQGSERQETSEPITLVDLEEEYHTEICDGRESSKSTEWGCSPDWWWPCGRIEAEAAESSAGANPRHGARPASPDLLLRVGSGVRASGRRQQLVSGAASGGGRRRARGGELASAMGGGRRGGGGVVQEVW